MCRSSLCPEPRPWGWEVTEAPCARFPGRRLTFHVHFGRSWDLPARGGARILGAPRLSSGSRYIRISNRKQCFNTTNVTISYAQLAVYLKFRFHWGPVFLVAKSYAVG